MIDLSFEREDKLVGNNIKTLNSLGFGTLMATSCPSDRFLYLNKIAAIEVIVEDAGTNEKMDVSENFKIKGVNQTYTLEEYLIKYSFSDFGFSDFYIEIDKTVGVPDSAFFIVNVLLEDDELLTSKTNQINFN